MAAPKTPLLTTDCVICDRDGRVLLIRRKNEPFKGTYALPGGFVDIGETVEAACRREALEETGLAVGELRLVGVYSDPYRDPRGHTVSIVYSLACRGRQVPKRGLTPRRRRGSRTGGHSILPSITPRSWPMPSEL